MSSFIAKLYLEGKVYTLLRYHLNLTGNIDQNGKPKGASITRELNLKVESQGQNSLPLLHWALSDSGTKDGKIVFFKRDGLSKLQEIQLKKASCTYFNEVFDSTNTEPMYIDLCITNGILCGSEITSKLIYRPPESELQPEKKEKEIVEIRIMDENFEKELEFIPFNGKCYALVKTKNYKEGEQISIKIEENLEGEKSGNSIFLTGFVDKEENAKLEEQVQLSEKK